ncbi:MAG: class II fumarate hydratase [Deltaproteobacteria bacterium]|nr:class II fumarate hydratase [Deltaproteobacteria bacterium]
MPHQADEADGTVRNGLRLESDSLGQIGVPADRYWGAETQRALSHFAIGDDRVPGELIRALAIIKKAAAIANQRLGRLPEEKARPIIQAAEEAAEGKLEGHFPLSIWCSGSGTQINMNLNEVIANRAIEITGGKKGTKKPIHPNDDVNLSQSTNDVFPSAMNMAVITALNDRLLPAVGQLRDGIGEKAGAWERLAKTGRTHLMDALPLTLGQEWSGYVGMLDDGLARIRVVVPWLSELALGGTAVGTGLGAPERFAGLAIGFLADLTALPLVPAPNRFTVQGAHDALVSASAMLKTLAVSLYKIANDIRLLSSGPRCGLQELILPANEPGSSMMPGKVNPTQCEVMAMVCAQVMGYDVAVALAGAGGMLEMNVYKPLMVFNILHSIRLLSDACGTFLEFLVKGAKPNEKQIEGCLDHSLMLVTALTPLLGHDRASRIARLADHEGITLREAALRLKAISPEDFDRLIDPRGMTGPAKSPQKSPKKDQ